MMEADYLIELMDYAIKRILDDVRNNKITAYKVATRIGTSQNVVTNMLEKGATGMRYSTLCNLLTFYEEYYGVLKLPKNDSL
jgi:hypothetical protein